MGQDSRILSGQAKWTIMLAEMIDSWMNVKTIALSSGGHNAQPE